MPGAGSPCVTRCLCGLAFHADVRLWAVLELRGRGSPSWPFSLTSFTSPRKRVHDATQPARVSPSRTLINSRRPKSLYSPVFRSGCTLEPSGELKTTGLWGHTRREGFGWSGVWPGFGSFQGSPGNLNVWLTRKGRTLLCVPRVRLLPPPLSSPCLQGTVRIREEGEWVQFGQAFLSSGGGSPPAASTQL